MNGRIDFGLTIGETYSLERIIEGLTMRWRSKKAAETTQAYFGGGITDITELISSKVFFFNVNWQNFCFQ